VVWAAEQLDSQQGWPARPHTPQAPVTHTDPLLQSCPSATQTPARAASADGPASAAGGREQQPPPQRLSAQHTAPGSPQRTHRVCTATDGGTSELSSGRARHRRLSFAQVGCARISAGQHGESASPQPVQRPLAQAP
jgi:hypothetical protein